MRKSVQREMLGVDRRTAVGEAYIDGGGDLVVPVRPAGRLSRRCPRCGRELPAYDRQPARRWRALDQGALRCWLEYAPARVSCPEHGVVVEAVPWAAHGARFTAAFEDQTAWLACRMTATAVAQAQRVSWAAVGSCCARSLARLEEAAPDRLSGLRRIGVDETGFARGRVMTVVTDLDRGRAVWCCEGVGSEACDAFFSLLGRRQRRRIHAVCGDGADWVDAAVRKWCPKAKRVMDKFHVVQWAEDALDEARRAAWASARREVGRLVCFVKSN